MAVEKIPRWESELWSYITKGDGEHCPMYNECQVRLQGCKCLDDHKFYLQNISTFMDDDEFTLSDTELGKLEFISCAKVGKIFQLVEKLAQKYLEMGNIDSPPVPELLIELCDTNSPIEIRQVPLKAYHGAIWHLRDIWVVHVNKNDTPARRRYSLFHEAFHILAHCSATPVFRKIGVERGSFNELLADHFSGSILMPAEWARKKWAEVRDLNRMAEIFQIPKSMVWFGLKGMGLI